MNVTSQPPFFGPQGSPQSTAGSNVVLSVVPLDAFGNHCPSLSTASTGFNLSAQCLAMSPSTVKHVQAEAQPQCIFSCGFLLTESAFYNVNVSLTQGGDALWLTPAIVLIDVVPGRVSLNAFVFVVKASF